MFATAGSARPLSGITVVDLTRYLPGPYCTRVLADLGATVVKVEPPAGDPMRAIALYDRLNAGKRIVTLDLRGDHARAELDALLADADVCVESFRPSSAKASGVDGATLRARHPHLIHCSISGYGQTGRDVERAGHDLTYQAQAGLLDTDPKVPTLLIADVTGALHASIQILAALVRRSRSGTGASLDISLFDAAASWQPFVAPRVLRGDYACYNVYETSDGAWIALGALEAKFWTRFCERVGRPEWSAMQFAGDPDRSALLGNVRALFRSQTQSAWIATFTAVDCCFMPIR